MTAGEAEEKGQKKEAGSVQAPRADFLASPRGPGAEGLCVRWWFGTGLGVREGARGAGSRWDGSALHLPVGVSLWKSTSELKPNKKVN